MPLETRSVRSAPPVSIDPGSRSSAEEHGIFRKEGEYWTVGYGGKAFRLKDTKGLGYLAHLLRHPDVEFHVLDLFGGIASHRDDDYHADRGLPDGDKELETAGIQITRLGDAGEMLDDQAKAEYRRRLSDLHEQLDQAKELGNVKGAERAEQEIDALTMELSRAVGLGGRSRRAASASERARQSITKTIKAVVDRIAQSDASLGDFFSRCIRTGTFCSYHPDPTLPISWEFAAATVDPPEQRTSGDDSVSKRSEEPQAPRAMLEVSQFSLAERTAFAGREAESEAVRAVIDRALKGQGAVVMLGGGAGVGKTRLAMEMAEYATHHGFRSYVGHCYEREEPFPYLPFAEIIESSLAQAPSLELFRSRIGENAAALAQVAPSLRRVFPDIPEPLDLPAQQRRRYLFQGLSEGAARAAQVRPLLFILDDLQWADESTLALLIHLSNRVPQFPLVIIGTYRDGFSESNAALVRSLEELIRHGVRPLRLGGLTKDSVAQMLRGLSNAEPPENLVDVIFEESQGNPFFVEEVYRHLMEEGKVFDENGRFRSDIRIDEVDVPENVRLVVSRRLERLDDNEKRALAAAAVIGRSFSFQLLTAISRIDIDELFIVIEKAQQMGIIVASFEGPEKPFTFAHELVRQTLLAGISMPRKQQLHANVADAIERQCSDSNGCAGEICDHLIKAGPFADRKRLVRWLMRAGKAALDASAFEEARRSFNSALSHLSDADRRERADLLASLARAELGREQWEAAVADLREALEIYVKLGDREMIGRGFTELADAFAWVGRLSDAAETARRGLAHLQEEISPNRVNLLSVLGQTLSARADLDPACQALQEALNIASKLGDPKLKARALEARSIARLHFFQLKDAADDGLRSEALRGSDAPPWQRALHLRILLQIMLHLGRRDEAFKIVDELEPLAIKIGQHYAVALCRHTRAWAEFGREPDLFKLRTSLRQLSSSGPAASYVFYDVLSEVQASILASIRGDWARALEHAEEACRPEIDRAIRGFGEALLFRQMAYSGNRDGAMAILRDRRDWLPVTGQNNTRGSWWMLALVIEGLQILGERSQAETFYSLARELLATGAVVLWPIPRLIQTIVGIAAGAAREWNAAEEHFKLALQQAASFPDMLEQAEIRRFYSMMLIDRGARSDREKARTLLAEAMETYTRIGMPRHCEMAAAVLD